MSERLVKELARVAVNAAVVTAAKGATSMRPENVEADRTVLQHEAEKQIAANPELQHATNSEPWYRSRVTLGALVAIIAGILPLAGVTLDAEDQAILLAVLMGIGSVCGGLLALWGRWKAKRPLGA